MRSSGGGPPNGAKASQIPSPYGLSREANLCLPVSPAQFTSPIGAGRVSSRPGLTDSLNLATARALARHCVSTARSRTAILVSSVRGLYVFCKTKPTTPLTEMRNFRKISELAEQGEILCAQSAVD